MLIHDHEEELMILFENENACCTRPTSIKLL